VPPLLGRFPAADFGVKIVAELKAGRTVVISDLLSAEMSDEQRTRETARAVDTRAILVVPFVRDGLLSTIVYLNDRAPREWHDDDVFFMEELAERTRLVMERAAAEDQLRELNATLEARVEARTVELKAAEEARRTADALYRAFFEHTPEPLFVIGVQPDGSFTVEQTNPAHEAGVGLRLQDIAGKRIDEILPAAAAARVIEAYRHAAATGEVYQYRDIFELSNGPQHWDTTIVPLREGDRVVRLFGSSRDVTRQVLAEEALRQSQKLEAMGSLTGGVAHDFNNLLTPILGALDLLQRKGLGGDREQRLIGGALASAERAKTLVQRLLAFARRQPLRAVPVNVAELVEGMTELISSTIGPKIELKTAVPGGLPPVLADPNQLEMALLNLSVNARDAMEEQGTLRIEAAAEEVGSDNPAKLEPGKYVRITVADTGTGMDEQTLARAIDPFFSTKGVGRGTGLGLSMAHGLLAQLGGSLSLDSRLGVGTTVNLWLPQSSEAAEHVTDVHSAVPTSIESGTVLLVDDEDSVRATTATMLADLGYSVHEASSSEEALRLMEDGLMIDLLVTDHLMPGMNGAELAAQVAGRTRGLRALLISGYAERAPIPQDLLLLAKPFTLAELADALERIKTPSPAAAG
jgi:PAS domain S-box-containing protein